jgi:hypothetical protein
MECPSKHAFYFQKCHTQRGGKDMFDEVPFYYIKRIKTSLYEKSSHFFMLGKDLKGDHCGKSRPMFIPTS